MKTYGVSLPITGYVYLEIEAETEEEAEEAAFNSDFTADSIEEWDVHKAIVTGNVFHGHMNKVSVEELET